MLDFEGNYSELILNTCRKPQIYSQITFFILAEINLKNKSVKEPRFTPDGKTLIWLQRSAGGPHAACMSLVKTTAPLSETVSATCRKWKNLVFYINALL